MTNNISEIQQTKITIGGQEYDGYKTPEGYFMNLSQVARILNKHDKSVRQVFASQSFKALLGKGLTVRQISGQNSRPVILIIPLTSWIASQQTRS